ncbi:hypothetical protein C2G38_2097546 [Gigaspora rosea]|uniref:Uncharacterized protein n=1 Tax=Gigaspora rosea TaxID=44941 RepID=A0A397UU63_9GLOM|nr:hypothetical protein C2G38_2097546 [Gigaspora rosea]
MANNVISSIYLSLFKSPACNLLLFLGLSLKNLILLNCYHIFVYCAFSNSPSYFSISSFSVYITVNYFGYFVNIC